MHQSIQKTRKREVQMVFESKTRVQGNFFLLYYTKLDDKNTPCRFSIVISKKTEQSAAKRNLLKRQIRYAIQKHRSILKNGSRFILYAQQKIKNAKFQEIESDIIDLLKKVHIYD